MRPRHALLFAFVLTSVALAGCASLPGTQPPSTTTTTVAPSALSDSTAKEQALNAEETYLSAHLQNASCLESWGTEPTAVSKQATVMNRTTSGVVVDVTHPYHYATTDGKHADVGSDARYLVTLNDTTRVSGDDIHPC